ncbi:hypothetical protein MKW94_000201 [Papaver nudicaule]|uniref:DNA replication licensing factor MCM2 n=1 Tax=Papaver nudicaule TaxID=74823 RepID=A0AA42B1B2_PAPNU|nr:hypothetical protein [Papaver nudicaule]
MVENSSTPDSSGFSTDSETHSDAEEAELNPSIVLPWVLHRAEEEEGDGEYLYRDNFLNDYGSMGDHDQYERVGLDDSSEDERDFDQIMKDKRAAEVELDIRHRRTKRSRASSSKTEPKSHDDAEGTPSSPGRFQGGWDSRDDISMTDQTDDEPHDDQGGAHSGDGSMMYEVQGTLREWITRDEVRRLIAKDFKEFLLASKNQQQEFEYIRVINEMVAANKCSLEIDYVHFVKSHPNIAIWLADAPQPVLEVMEDVAERVVFNLHPNYKNIHQKIFVRITSFPVFDQIRNIRQIHLNTMIRIEGVVTRRSGVFPQLQKVKYDCNNCCSVLGAFLQNSYSEVKEGSEVKVGSCPECLLKGPFTVNMEQTVYRNYQKLTLQESPGTVPAGRVPRHVAVTLLNDLIDCARPGEEIEVTGVYTNNFDLSLNTQNGCPVFATVVVANYVTKKGDFFSAYKLTQEDKHEIEKLAKDPRIGERIVKSIAPSIYGHEDIKMALALSMFGGQEKNVDGKHRIRGDINVLLLGDPGTAKSHFLKYAEKTVQRAIYTTGKGASAVGLTAAVHKDPKTREWTLEGGALVLADRGICLIDDFDKMNKKDRVSIHEAMEQQSISISKAGIVTSLQARCSLIAAANPIGGRYDSSKTFSQNVELTDPIISRFDVLCVVKDVVDPVLDEKTAESVIKSHCKSLAKGAKLDDMSASDYQADPDASAEPVDQEILSQDMLKKYITYAKLNVFPRLHDAELNKVTEVYAKLRRESLDGQGVPVAVRHIESMIRISEAHARMHLRQHVNQDDVDMAIRVLLESFISTQKLAVQIALQQSFRKYMTLKKDHNGILIHILHELVKDALHVEELVNGSTAGLTQIEVKVVELHNKARDYEIYDLQPFFSSPQFSTANFHLNEDGSVIKHPLAR